MLRSKFLDLGLHDIIGQVRKYRRYKVRGYIEQHMSKGKGIAQTFCAIQKRTWWLVTVFFGESGVLQSDHDDANIFQFVINGQCERRRPGASPSCAGHLERLLDREWLLLALQRNVSS